MQQCGALQCVSHFRTKVDQSRVLEDVLNEDTTLCEVQLNELAARKSNSVCHLAYM